MESYIIRIARRKKPTRGEYVLLDGVVEDAEGTIRLPFHNAEELWSILGDAARALHNDHDTISK